MSTLIWALGLGPSSSYAQFRAQVEAPNAAGVTMGHFQTVVQDVQASRRFWTTLGGTSVKIDGTDVSLRTEWTPHLE